MRPTDGETCQYCRTLGVPCEFNLSNRKRPFYRVSGDVYDHSIKLLRRFVSEDELPDLTVENIQRVLAKLEVRSSSHSGTRTPSREVEGNGADDTHHGPGEIQEVVERGEHPLLQEDLGCMILDSLGKYRGYLLSALKRYVANTPRLRRSRVFHSLEPRCSNGMREIDSFGSKSYLTVENWFAAASHARESKKHPDCRDLLAVSPALYVLCDTLL